MVTGIMNGGLTATLIDCHSFWTALAATYQEEGRGFGEGTPFEFLTGSLQVRYLHPIAVGVELELRARIAKSGSRSRVVACSVFVDRKECARAEVTVVRIKCSRLNFTYRAVTTPRTAIRTPQPIAPRANPLPAGSSP